MTTEPEGRAGSSTMTSELVIWLPDNDPDWRVGNPRRMLCRQTKCRAPAVASLLRGSFGRSGTRWFYCEKHLYGRRIRDGVLERQGGTP